MIDLRHGVVSVNNAPMNRHFRNSSIRKAGSAVLLLLVTVSILQAQRGKTEQAENGVSVDEMITGFMRDNKVPGLSVAVIQDPYITRVTGYGYSDAGRKLLTGSNTLFALGRLAEAYTGVAVLQLVEQNKVKLDDPIENYVPLTPQAWHGVTVRQLLQHQSGLPDYMKASGKNPNDSPADLFTAVSETAPVFPPGTQTASSATDYLLLQLLIESVSGQSYEGFVKANQFDRIGLKKTFFAAELVGLPRELPAADEPHSEYLTNPAVINPTEPATAYGGDDPNPTAAPTRAAIFTSAEDLGLWEIALSGDILIKDAELRKILYTPAKLKDGSVVPTSGPWFFPGHPGLMEAQGNAQGFSSLVVRFTDAKDLLSITLLANKEGLDLQPLARRIAGAYDPALGAPQNLAGLTVRQSPYSSDDTLKRLAAALTTGGATSITKAPSVTLNDKDGKPLAAKEQWVASFPLPSETPEPASQDVRYTLLDRGGELWIAAEAITSPAGAKPNVTDAITKIRATVLDAVTKAASAESK